MQDQSDTAPDTNGRLEQLRDKLARSKSGRSGLVIAERDGEIFFEQDTLSSVERGRVQSLVAIACLFEDDGSTSVSIDTEDGKCRALTLASGRIVADPGASTDSRAQFRQRADELVTELGSRQESR